jgi:hypothetical protein
MLPSSKGPLNSSRYLIFICVHGNYLQKWFENYFSKTQPSPGNGDTFRKPIVAVTSHPQNTSAKTLTEQEAIPISNSASSSSITAAESCRATTQYENWRVRLAGVSGRKCRPKRNGFVAFEPHARYPSPTRQSMTETTILHTGRRRVNTRYPLHQGQSVPA